MRTLMIWTDFEDLPKLYMLEGDYRHLDKVIININQDREEDEKELTTLFYGNDGIEKLTPIDISSKEIASLLDCFESGSDFVICCGFVP